MNRSKTLVAMLALAVPLPAVIAGCGGDDESSDDPQAVIEAAFANETQIESGVLDLSFDLSAEGTQGGSLTATVSGPFTSDPDDPTDVGQLDLDITASGEGAAAEAIPEDFEAGLTITEDNLFVNYNDTDYELGEESFTQLQEQQEAAVDEAGVEESSSFKDQCEQAIEAQGGDPVACDIDIAAWFSGLEDEGTEDLGGAETNHVSGTLDVEQMISDLFQLGASVPGATGGIDPALIEPQLGMISEAVSGAEFDVYASTEDETLRGLDLALDLDTAALGGGAAGVDAASVGFSLEISEVGEEQTFEAPADPQPIEDLASEFGLPGLPGGALPGGGTEVPGGGAAEIPGGGSLPPSIDPQCIQDAAGDPAEIQQCLE